MRLLNFFILSVLIHSCNEVKEKNGSKMQEPVIINSGDKYIYPDTIFVYDKQKVLESYVKQLKDCLKQNKLPEFIFDECLDVNSMGYCYVSSHESISLRSDIIKQLKKDEVREILSLSEPTLLKKICITDFSAELLNSGISTYELLNEALK